MACLPDRSGDWSQCTFAFYNKLDNETFFMGFDHVAHGRPPYYMWFLVVNAYNFSFHFTGFDHKFVDMDYFTSIYDPLRKWVFVVPFHFAYGNKAYVFDYDSKLVKISAYKTFVINVDPSTPIFINSVKFSSDYRLYYYQVNYTSNPD